MPNEIDREGERNIQKGVTCRGLIERKRERQKEKTMDRLKNRTGIRGEERKRNKEHFPDPSPARHRECQPSGIMP